MNKGKKDEEFYKQMSKKTMEEIANQMGMPNKRHGKAVRKPKEKK